MLAIGSDHGGYELKQEVIKYLAEHQIEYKDFGCYDKASCDYPAFGQAVAKAVASGTCDRGIVICTTGIGISIAANKVKGIRCALCTSVDMGRLCREHNNANVLALGAGNTDIGTALEITEAFLNTEFAGGRHAARVDKIMKYEA